MEVDRMPTVEQMRESVVKAYSGEAWKQKVLAMSDGQIIAIYKNLVKQNKI